MSPHERLIAWQKAHEFTVVTLSALDRRSGARHEALADQLRRAAIAVSANIVEGSARSSATEFAACLSMALAAARESGYLVRLAADLEAIRTSERAVLEARCEQVCRLIVSLLRHISARPDRPSVSRSAAARASRAAPRHRPASPGPPDDD
ncbi:MAG: four helix bundle protein [Gemmatimonadaceae bacterium]|nr:four helix bundle protein [Gemmatimonadaceae bacterium]